MKRLKSFTGARRWLALPAMAVLLALGGSACGMEDSAINEIGLTYSGGWFEDKEFKGFLKPGATAKSTGFGSSTYRYRTDQRTFIAGPPIPGLDKDRQPDVGPVIIVSDDDVRLIVEYQLYFKLNRDEKVLRKFHENLGVKTGAWNTDGWRQLLQEYFAPQIERAMESAGLKAKWRELYGSEDARVRFQDETVARLQQAIREVIGDEYFCGPAYNGPGTDCGSYTFTVGKPTPINEDILKALEQEQANVSQTQAAAAVNIRIAAELEGKRQQVALYGQQGAVLLEAIASGKVNQIIVSTDGGNISIPTTPRP
jgi:hypothetical protein